MNPDPISTVAVVVLTLLSLVASVVAVLQLRQPRESQQQGRSLKRLHLLVGLTAAGCTATFIYRWIAVHSSWQPLESHFDGLLLLSALLGLMVWYLTDPSRIPALASFAMPVMTLVLLWSICAGTFTFRIFEPSPTAVAAVWHGVHLAGVYVGTLFVAAGAIFGSLYLYAEHRLQTRRQPVFTGKLASLESLEKLLVYTATLGFAVLTLGLATGLVIVTSGPTKLGQGWWHSPKVVLAVSAWLIYALIMNVRHASAFRGSRAAWLSIVGLALLLATFGIVSAGHRTASVPNESHAAASAPFHAPQRQGT